MGQHMTKLFLILGICFGALKSYAISPSELKDFEGSVETKLTSLARVQFGSAENISFYVKALLKKEEVNSEANDVGYLAIPAGSVTNQNIETSLQEIEIVIVASSRLPAEGVKAFQGSVRKVFAAYRPRIKVQTVDFVEAATRQPAQEKPVDPNNQKDNKKSEIGSWIRAGLLGVTLSFVGFFLYLGLGALAKALREGATSLAQSLGLSKSSSAPNTPPPVASPPPRSSKAENEYALKNLPEVIAQLRKLAESDPLKFVAVLTGAAEDLIGVRWFLSQIQDQDRQKIQKFLGPGRMRQLEEPLEVPVGYNIASWAQSFLERLVLVKMKGKVLIEEALSADEVSFLYQISPEQALRAGRELASPEAWRFSLEILPSNMLMTTPPLEWKEWNAIIRSSAITSSELQNFFPQYKAFFQNIEGEQSISARDPILFAKILPSIVGSLEVMRFGEDDQFIENLAVEYPELSLEVRKNFFTLNTFKEMEVSDLKAFFGNLENESVIAVLVCSQGPDRSFVQDLLPEGMKKTVVLDLFKKALEKNDPTTLQEALKKARKVFKTALDLHHKGRLRFRTKVSGERVA